MTFDDADLIAQYQAGDVAAFETLVQRHQTALFTFLLRVTANYDQAEDLFQETFLRVLKALPKYREDGIFRHWLFRIANNAVRDNRRRDTARLRRVFADEDRMMAAVSPTTRPDEDAINRDLATRVEDALKELPEEQRRVFLLRAHADMRFREIAEAEGVSVSTVISQMRYAVAKLKPLLEPFMEEP